MLARPLAASCARRCLHAHLSHNVLRTDRHGLLGPSRVVAAKRDEDLMSKMGVARFGVSGTLLLHALVKTRLAVLEFPVGVSERMRDK